MGLTPIFSQARYIRIYHIYGGGDGVTTDRGEGFCRMANGMLRTLMRWLCHRRCGDMPAFRCRGYVSLEVSEMK
jgi:hypothetical protein